MPDTSLIFDFNAVVSHFRMFNIWKQSKRLLKGDSQKGDYKTHFSVGEALFYSYLF